MWDRAIEEMTGVKSQDILGKGNYEYSTPFYQTRRPVLTDLTLRPDDETAKYYPFIRKENDCLKETGSLIKLIQNVKQTFSSYLKFFF